MLLSVRIYPPERNGFQRTLGRGSSFEKLSSEWKETNTEEVRAKSSEVFSNERRVRPVERERERDRELWR